MSARSRIPILLDPIHTPKMLSSSNLYQIIVNMINTNVVLTGSGFPPEFCNPRLR